MKKTRKNVLMLILVSVFACFSAADFDDCGCEQGRNTAIAQNQGNVSYEGCVSCGNFYEKHGKSDLPVISIEHPPKQTT